MARKGADSLGSKFTFMVSFDGFIDRIMHAVRGPGTVWAIILYPLTL